MSPEVELQARLCVKNICSLDSTMLKALKRNPPVYQQVSLWCRVTVRRTPFSGFLSFVGVELLPVKLHTKHLLKSLYRNISHTQVL